MATKPKLQGLLEQLSSLYGEALTLTDSERVEFYNQGTKTLRKLVKHIANDPVLSVQLVPTKKVIANDYNPNKVATPEMELLLESISADGVTMPVVTVEEGEEFVVVDGFHRQTTLKEKLNRKYIPCSVIDSKKADRMASTIRHNRARGKHQVDLMALIVKSLMNEGWCDADIAKKIGMTEEELLRLKQNVGVAALLAAPEYSLSWGVIDEQNG